MNVSLQLSGCNVVSAGSTNITSHGEFNTVVVNNTFEVPDEAGQLFRRPHRKVHRNRNRHPPSAKSAIALKRSIKKLTANLEPSAEHADLRTILDDISNKILNAVMFFATCGVLEAHSSFETMINNQIIIMQSVLDDFCKERTNWIFGRQSGLLSTFFHLWARFQWNYIRTRRIIKINYPMARSALKVSALLQEISAPYFFKGVLGNYVGFVDFFGADLALPERVCLDPDVFHAVLGLIFKEGPAQMVVATRGFDILVQGKLQTVGSEEWERIINEGEQLQLCVVVNGMELGKRICCPRCGYTCSSNDTQEWVYCYGCQSSFNLEAPTDERSGPSTTESDQAMPFKFYSIRLTPMSRNDESIGSCTETSNNNGPAQPRLAQVEVDGRILTERDALNYLDAIRTQFVDEGKPWVYNSFLDIMKEYRDKLLDPPGAVRRVASLFHHHSGLIEGFNNFLPNRDRIEVSQDQMASDPQY